ncbi:MAG TPA: PIN domain-containing protein [Solirubrobacterales bacterium]
MIVLDASVLIGHLDGQDPHHARARALLEASDAEPLGASTITLAETLVAPARVGRLGEARAALERLGVNELVLGEDAPGRLAQLRADTGRKLPDCCVLLAARERSGAVASFDAGLLGAARKLGLGIAEAGQRT